jgi:hypothetical protein
LRIDDERCRLQDIALFFIPAAQRFGGRRAIYAVQYRKGQLELVDGRLRFVERIGRESIYGDALCGGCFQVGLKIS